MVTQSSFSLSADSCLVGVWSCGHVVGDGCQGAVVKELLLSHLYPSDIRRAIPAISYHILTAVPFRHPVMRRHVAFVELGDYDFY